MDRDDFIITVYCLVCDQYRALFSEHPLRHGGFTPQLTDEEVITLELCGEYFKLNTDQDLFDYFRQHYPTWFPQLRDRSLFVRQAANLWQAKAAIQQRLTLVSGQATDPVQIIDTLPLPVCVFTRSRRDRCFKPNADYGHCAAKNLTYYGFKLGLRVSRLGMITYFPLLPARPLFQTQRRLWALRGEGLETLRFQTRLAHLARGYDYALSLVARAPTRYPTA